MIGLIKGLPRKVNMAGSPQPIVTFTSNVSGLYLPEILAYIQASQSGTGDPSPSNPRTINGVSSVDTTRTGKNLSTAPLVYATAYASTQVTEDGKSCTRFTCASTTIYTGVRFKPNTKYTVKFNAKTVKSGTPTVNSGAFVFFYSDNTYSAIYVGKEDTTWTDYTLTSTSGKTVIGVGTLATDWRLLVYVDNDTFQLEESNTATAYHAYTGQTATINLGGTFYGGYLNVTTGLLTVTHVDVDLGNLSWAYATDAKRWRAIKSDMKQYSSRSDDITFEKYATDTTATIGSEWKGYISGSYIYVHSLDSVTPPSGKAVYPLATPQTYQLTPAQIEQLLGQNNVFCSSGDVAVTQIWARRDRSIISRG